ncbi:MAG: hypothetical protein R3E01_15365 [Pirellulaceae bacterium]|nr:hypothetical protein [Planctomycetales bacterium]
MLHLSQNVARVFSRLTMVALLAAMAGCGPSAQQTADSVKALKAANALVVSNGASVTLSSMDEGTNISEAVAHLKNLPNLGALNCTDMTLAPEDFAVIGKLSNLTSLTLNNTNLDDAGLAKLSGLRKLQALNIASTQVTGDGLSALSGLGAVTTLDLSGSKVTSGLEPLAKMASLDTLTLRSMTLDDGALAGLASSKSLGTVRLGESQYSDTDKEQLQSAIAGLEVQE